MTKHIFKITKTEDITPRITTWNWKGRPENKKKPGVGVNRFFFYKQKSYHSVLTSQFLNIYMYIYKKKSFKNNIIMNIEYAQILRCQMGVVQDAPHSSPPGNQKYSLGHKLNLRMSIPVIVISLTPHHMMYSLVKNPKHLVK